MLKNMSRTTTARPDDSAHDYRTSRQPESLVGIASRNRQPESPAGIASPNRSTASWASQLGPKGKRCREWIRQRELEVAGFRRGVRDRIQGETHHGAISIAPSLGHRLERADPTCRRSPQSGSPAGSPHMLGFWWNFATASSAPDPRQSIQRAALVDGQVVVSWADGHRSTFHAIWLRHPPFFPGCTLPAGPNGRFPTPSDPALAPHAIAVTEGGDLRVLWRPGDLESVFEASWLRDRCYSAAERARRRRTVITWDAAAAQALPPIGAVIAARRSSMGWYPSVASDVVITVGYSMWTAPFSRRQVNRKNGPIKDRTKHGAYPALEYRGLVFAYLGPSEEQPEFPIFHSFDGPGDELLPYAIHSPCNWLQVTENAMDPFHSVFLHSRVAGPQFPGLNNFETLPVVEWHERPYGWFYTNARRVGDHAWVRMHDDFLPSFAQNGSHFESAHAPRYFRRSGLTKWVVPVDDTNSMMIAWRHFIERDDPHIEEMRDHIGWEKVDFYGQTAHRPYYPPRGQSSSRSRSDPST